MTMTYTGSLEDPSGLLGDEGDKYAVREIEFLIMDLDSPYNAILGRNSINTFKMVVSMDHLKDKFT